jgi:CubicO group peptidase (beta-lactamase class C family)
MAYISLKYVLNNKLDLNASIYEYLTENELNILNIRTNRNSRYRDVTVRMLFSHISGIPDRAGLLYTHLQFAPGSGFTYSGEGYYILQKIIEKIEQKPIDKIFKKFFKFKNCSFKYEKVFSKNMATPYNTMINPHGAQSFYSSIDSLVKIIKKIISDREVFTLMTTVQYRVNEHISTGLGPFILNDEIIWQWGDKKNFKNFLYYDYKKNTGFISLSNSIHGWEYIKPSIDNHVLQFLRGFYNNNYI